MILSAEFIFIEVIILKEKYNESAENYLETILVLSKKLPVVRSVDIANELEDVYKRQPNNFTKF